MIIAGRYSFNGGAEFVQQHYPLLVAEVEAVIDAVDASLTKTKVSDEGTMLGKMLFSPKELNIGFRTGFALCKWRKHRVPCVYPTEYYTPGYQPRLQTKGAFREMDFVKEKLGVEVQFGKYAFMVYNVCAKMTIFQNMGIINAGIEVVPVQQLAAEMSTGVSYFEQFVWDLQQRGTSNIDVPVLIIGVDA